MGKTTSTLVGDGENNVRIVADPIYEIGGANV